jgi:hypothetical protein
LLNVPSHLSVRVRMSALFIDYWDSLDGINVYVDNTVVMSGIYVNAVSVGSLCY